MFAVIMNKDNKNRLQTGLIFILALLISLGLKYHYSRAGSDDLLWVLRPTAGMVEYLSGVRFEKEENRGYVNHERQVIIAPSCAGINFMIIAFCMASFSGLTTLKRSRLKNLWLGISFLTAYLFTLSVNSFRIIVSIYSFRALWFQSFATAKMVHRIEGIIIYLSCLILFHSITGKIVRWMHHKAGKKERRFYPYKWICKTSFSTFIPAFWYCGLTIGVPLLNRAYQKGGQQFVVHSLTVLSVCFVVSIIFFFTHLSCKHLEVKIKRRNGCDYHLRFGRSHETKNPDRRR